MNKIRIKYAAMVLTNPQRLAALSSVRVLSTTSVANQETTSAKPSSIKLPAYVPRGPTDILRALSQTVGVDHTAAHFKYHDDPYLIPTSNNNKRIFALAAESGRKAAKWIKQEHADLFQVRNPQHLPCIFPLTIAPSLYYSTLSLSRPSKRSWPRPFTRTRPMSLRPSCRT